MFSKAELKRIHDLALRLTGAESNAERGRDLFSLNVQKRMRELNQASLDRYLDLVEKDTSEANRLISALTIHTTAWFRENPHYVRFQQILLEKVNSKRRFRMWCAAVSTGEELYSFALMLEEFRNIHPGFEYELLGTDIDPVSVDKAQSAIYEQKELNPLVLRYKEHLLFGSDHTEGLFTFSPEIRNRARFRTLDLRQAGILAEGPFDLVVCRNVLIYFDQELTRYVLSQISNNLSSGGHLMVGHSESFDPKDFGLEREGHTVYRKLTAKPIDLPLKDTAALIIDAKAASQSWTQDILSEIGIRHESISNEKEAQDCLSKKRYDLIIYSLPDETTPETWSTLKKWSRDIPLVLISNSDKKSPELSLRILELGAQEYIERRALRHNRNWVKEVFQGIAQSAPRLDNHPTPLNRSPHVCPEVILIGASTGGPQVLSNILSTISSPNCPPIVVVQHIAPSFLAPFAQRMASNAGLSLGEFEDGAPLLPGHIYFATEFEHIGVTMKGGCVSLVTSKSDPINGHTPSVEFLFTSALGLGVPILAVLLTGMGSDGAKALSYLKEAGAYTMAQIGTDCVVYGMPKEAIRLGATCFVGTQDEISQSILKALSSPKLIR